MVTHKVNCYKCRYLQRIWKGKLDIYGSRYYVLCYYEDIRSAFNVQRALWVSKKSSTLHLFSKSRTLYRFIQEISSVIRLTCFWCCLSLYSYISDNHKSVIDLYEIPFWKPEVATVNSYRRYTFIALTCISSVYMQPDIFLIADWPQLIQTVKGARVCRSKGRYSLEKKDIIPKSIKTHSIVYNILRQWGLLQHFSFSQQCYWIFESLGMLRHVGETVFTETSKDCSSSRTPARPWRRRN